MGAGQDRAEVGFATFDNQIQFYSLRPGQTQPQMLVIPDADAPYCPLPQLVKGPLSQCHSLAEGLLDQIPRIYQGTNHLDGCATAAIEACILALKVGTSLAYRQAWMLSSLHYCHQAFAGRTSLRIETASILRIPQHV